MIEENFQIVRLRRLIACPVVSYTLHCARVKYKSRTNHRRLMNGRFNPQRYPFDGCRPPFRGNLQNSAAWVDGGQPSKG